MICLAVGCVLVLREVGRNRQDCRAGLGGEEGYGEVRLVLLRYAEWLNGWVCVFVHCKYGAARAAFCELIVE